MISALAAVGYGQSETLSSVSGMKLFWSQNRSLWLTVGQPQHIHLYYIAITRNYTSFYWHGMEALSTRKTLLRKKWADTENE